MEHCLTHHGGQTARAMGEIRGGKLGPLRPTDSNRVRQIDLLVRSEDALENQLLEVDQLDEDSERFLVFGASAVPPAHLELDGLTDGIANHRRSHAPAAAAGKNVEDRVLSDVLDILCSEVAGFGELPRLSLGRPHCFLVGKMGGCGSVALCCGGCFDHVLPMRGIRASAHLW